MGTGVREVNVERADVALDVAIAVATEGGDLEVALRELLHACGHHRDSVAAARHACADLLALDRNDVILQRALQLLDGAMRTALFAPLPAAS